MTPIWKMECWAIILIRFGCTQAFAEPFAKGPYLGQTPPGSTAQVFAPGLISNTRPQTWEAFGTFSADGNTFCFTRCYMRGSQLIGGVHITENSDGGWTAPKLVESIQESGIPAWGPCLSPDANSIYFTYALVQPLSKRNIYRCDRAALGWTAPQVLAPPVSSCRELTCSIAMNNNLYFGSGRERGHGKSLIWYAPFVNNAWPKAINHSVVGGDPGIAPAESFMVFTDKDMPGRLRAPRPVPDPAFAGWNLVHTAKPGPTDQFCLY